MTKETTVWSLRPTRDIEDCVADYCAEKGVNRAVAVNELVLAGWKATHEHLLANGLMQNVRDVMTAVAAADARDRNDAMDAYIERIEESLLRVEAASIAAMLLTGSTEETLDETYRKALQIALGR